MALQALIPLGISLIERLFPDKDAQAKAKLELLALDQTGQLQDLATRAGIVTAEAQGEGALQRNWRPIMMLWFGFLVGCYWFGFTPENLSETHITELFRLVQIGIGGYVVGRSAEKVAKELKKK